MADRTHACPGGCGARVDRALFACKPCWWRLPLAMRQAINTTHRVDPSAHRAAMADAMQWYRDHPRSTP